MRFTKKDLWYSILTGFYTGAIAAGIAGFLKLKAPLGAPFILLAAIIPGLWIAGVTFGYFLGRWLKFFNQFGKFAAIGFTNAAVDFGILNLLLWSTGISAGFWYAVFKALSFTVASIHSYVWNKYWVFEAEGSRNVGQEFAKFFSVAVAATAVNVAAASVIVNLIPAPAAIPANIWANLGAVIGSATALVVSFVGFRVAVFKKK